MNECMLKIKYNYSQTSKGRFRVSPILGNQNALSIALSQTQHNNKKKVIFKADLIDLLFNFITSNAMDTASDTYSIIAFYHKVITDMIEC